MMRTNVTSWMDRLELRLARHSEILRGIWMRWRGVSAGRRFGLGKSVRILYPRCLAVEDDVTIEGPAYLHCLSERGVRIGRSTSIDRNLWLYCGGTGQDYSHGYFEIGEHSYIGCNAVMGAGGGIRIGDHVLIGQSVNIHAESHHFEDPNRLIADQGVGYQGVVIEDDVWVGSRATILDGVTVGCGAVIGAGSVVTRSVRPYAVVVGVPAHVIGSRRGTDQ